MFSTEDFANALDSYDYSFQSGQVVQGKVTSIDRDEALIDIGGKSIARLPANEASMQRSLALSDVLELEEERDFLVIREQDSDGQVTLSLKRLEAQRIWERLQESQDNGEIVQATVLKPNRGGVVVELLGMRGFVPRSHLAQPDAMETLTGQTLTLSYLEVNPDTNKLVLSERLAQRSLAVQTLERGQLIEGTVTGIKPFGAFVNFDGTTGLLHIKEISESYIRSINDVFQVGQTIRAVIVSIDEARGRISLSTRALEKSPGEFVTSPEVVFEEAEKRANFYRSRI